MSQLGNALITTKIDIDKYLNAKALKLSKNVVKSTLYVLNITKVTPCIYMGNYIPKENGKIQDKYIEAWANMLNWLVDNKIWDYGVMDLCSTIDLYHNKTYIYSFIFGEYDFIQNNPKYNDKINEMMGWSGARLEGEVSNSNW